MMQGTVFEDSVQRASREARDAGDLNRLDRHETIFVQGRDLSQVDMDRIATLYRTVIPVFGARTASRSRDALPLTWHELTLGRTDEAAHMVSRIRMIVQESASGFVDVNGEVVR